jgi:hypothetical protein
LLYQYWPAVTLFLLTFIPNLLENQNDTPNNHERNPPQNNNIQINNEKNTSFIEKEKESKIILDIKEDLFETNLLNIENKNINIENENTLLNIDPENINIENENNLLNIDPDIFQYGYEYNTNELVDEDEWDKPMSGIFGLIKSQLENPDLSNSVDSDDDSNIELKSQHLPTPQTWRI